MRPAISDLFARDLMTSDPNGRRLAYAAVQEGQVQSRWLVGTIVEARYLAADAISTHTMPSNYSFGSIITNAGHPAQQRPARYVRVTAAGSCRIQTWNSCTLPTTRQILLVRFANLVLVPKRSRHAARQPATYAAEHHPRTDQRAGGVSIPFDSRYREVLFVQSWTTNTNCQLLGCTPVRHICSTVGCGFLWIY